MTLLSNIIGDKRIKPTTPLPFDRAIICAKRDKENLADCRWEHYQTAMSQLRIPENRVHTFNSWHDLVDNTPTIVRKLGRREKLVAVVEVPRTIMMSTWKEVVKSIRDDMSVSSIKFTIAVDLQRAHTRTLSGIDDDNDKPTYAPNPSGPQDVIAEAQSLGHDVLEFTQATAPQDIQRYFADLAKRTGVLQNSTSQ